MAIIKLKEEYAYMFTVPARTERSASSASLESEEQEEDDLPMEEQEQIYQEDDVEQGLLKVKQGSSYEVSKYHHESFAV